MGPRSLQRKVQFDVRYFFCQRGSENIYNMKRDTFELGYIQETGMSYVFKAKDEKQKNHKEYHNPIITGYMPQLLDDTGRPHKLCPVRSFENYTFTLNKDVEYLWQTPNDAAFNRGEPKCFKKGRVGEGKLGMFMQEISALCELSRKYTNHSIRVTGTTNLTQASFSPNQIMSITGHKSVNSLAMYQRVHGDEKVMMGVSLAYSLFHPQEVQQALQQTKQRAIAPATPSSSKTKDINSGKKRLRLDLSKPQQASVPMQQIPTNVMPIALPSNQPAATISTPPPSQLQLLLKLVVCKLQSMKIKKHRILTF